MKIDRRLSKHYQVTCAQGHEFQAVATALSAECPRCGETALMVELVTRYWLAGHEPNPKVLAGAD